MVSLGIEQYVEERILYYNRDKYYSEIIREFTRSCPPQTKSKACAHCTASTTELMPSLRQILFRWVRTVWTERWRWRAMSSFLKSRQTRESTSFSRLESWSKRRRFRRANCRNRSNRSKVVCVNWISLIEYFVWFNLFIAIQEWCPRGIALPVNHPSGSSEKHHL